MVADRGAYDECLRIGREENEDKGVKRSMNRLARKLQKALALMTPSEIKRFDAECKFMNGASAFAPKYQTAVDGVGIDCEKRLYLKGMRSSSCLLRWQPQGIFWAKSRCLDPKLRGCIVMDEMGLGKTYMTETGR